MTFEVVFVNDDQLSSDWVLVRTATAFYAFIRESRVRPDVLSSAWEAFVDYCGLEHSPLLASA